MITSSETDKRKLRFGIISAGPMAEAHIRGVKANVKADLKTICDTDLEKALNIANKYGIPDCYADYREILKDKDIDIVIVASPDQLHTEHTVTALESGKHVLCEKPMALTIEECVAMIDASKRTSKKLMIGQICRYTPAFKLTKKLIDEGHIGELFFIESEYAHDYSDIPGAGNWRKDPVRLRHAVIGGGCHAIDLLRWIAGNPSEVFAYANRKILKAWPVDDSTIAIMKFPNDVMGKVFVSIGCKRNYTMRSVFYGSKGTIIADNTSPYITVYKENMAKGEKVFNDVQEQTVGMVYPVNLDSHNTVGEIDEFINIINNDQKVLTDGIQGASTLAVCLAVVESARKGEKVIVRYL